MKPSSLMSTNLKEEKTKGHEYNNLKKESFNDEGSPNTIKKNN